jgi:hypothetical protein
MTTGHGCLRVLAAAPLLSLIVNCAGAAFAQQRADSPTGELAADLQHGFGVHRASAPSTNCG